MRVAMLYTWEPSNELAAVAAGRAPAHRVFGAAELPSFGVDVATCGWGRLPRRLRGPQVWKIWQGLWAVCIQRRLAVVVAVTEAAALPVLALAMLGLVRIPIVVIAVASLHPRNLAGRGSLLRRLLLRRARCVVVYASAQVELVTQRLGVAPERVRFVPFGVDVEFFAPCPVPPEPAWDVVSVGTNTGKDFPTLVGALPDESDCLIVTDPWNEREALAEPTHARVTVDHDVPIERLRDLYLKGRWIVLPLKDVDFSTGQTVLLETMALGRPVVVSDVRAIRDYAAADTVVLVPPGDRAALRRVLVSEPAPYSDAAAQRVRERFTSRMFSGRLAELCWELADSGVQQPRGMPRSLQKL